VVVERADTPFVKAALADTDRRVGEEKPVAPSFLLACVLWSDVKVGWDQRVAKRIPPFPALQEAIDEVFDARIGDVSGRGKLAADMREIWMMQPRFEKRIGSTPFSLVEQPRFRAGFDFLRLRAEVADVDLTLADWWQEFSMADDAAREDLIQQAKSEKGSVPASGAGKTRRAPRRRKPAAKNASGASGNSEPGQSPSGE
jgi:poly(A) polymerase